MNNKEKGAASIIVTMKNGELIVHHGTNTEYVIHKRPASKGIWDAIWDVIHNYDAEKTRVWTHIVGTDEERADFIKEWEGFLKSPVKSEKATYGWRMEAYVTDKQIVEFDMESDWFINYSNK
jgi:frataxin-like iron-binding protein CyaY